MWPDLLICWQHLPGGDAPHEVRVPTVQGCRGCLQHSAHVPTSILLCYSLTSPGCRWLAQMPCLDISNTEQTQMSCPPLALQVARPSSFELWVACPDVLYAAGSLARCPALTPLQGADSRATPYPGAAGGSPRCPALPAGGALQRGNWGSLVRQRAQHSGHLQRRLQPAGVEGGSH